MKTTTPKKKEVKVDKEHLSTYLASLKKDYFKAKEEELSLVEAYQAIVAKEEKPVQYIAKKFIK
jgi:hypothetical protein